MRTAAELRAQCFPEQITERKYPLSVGEIETELQKRSREIKKPLAIFTSEEMPAQSHAMLAALGYRIMVLRDGTVVISF